MKECKNHENVKRMLNPTCAKDYELGFKVTDTGRCPECDVSLMGLDKLLNEMIDNALLSSPKRMC